ncbi:MAG: hypothetical protein ABUL62_20485 [Myxococcales bacterium]|jgi:hypothetical protein
MTRLVITSGTRRGLAFAATLACASCHSKSNTGAVGTPLATSATPRPVDRLAPDELAAGNAEVWGFAVPREMQVEHRYQEVTHIIGNVKPDALANYVRDRVVVSHVEIGAARTIFPNARIKGGAADRVYELDVIPEPGLTRLVIRDMTPPKVEPGLSDADRWRQAGLTPEGRPLDPKAFE